MIWATEAIFRPCVRQKSTRSGRRAIVPSGFMTSQMTPAGFRPARRARSTAPSVWPARTRAPPSRARSGKTCPGRARSVGLVPSAIAIWIVRARSAALMPVVIPVRASIETVNAVPKAAVFSGVCGARARRSTISGARARHTRPRPWVAMKLMISGLTFSAAETRSPSFSRCSSSTRTIMRPPRSSSRISGIGLKGVSIARIVPAGRGGIKARRRPGPAVGNWRATLRRGLEQQERQDATKRVPP